jgi:hypothetical protein
MLQMWTYDYLVKSWNGVVTKKNIRMQTKLKKMGRNPAKSTYMGFEENDVMISKWVILF